jgi:hypothetical protein
MTKKTQTPNKRKKAKEPETPKTQQARSCLNQTCVTPGLQNGMTAGELGIRVPTKRRDSIAIGGFLYYETRSQKMSDDRKKKEYLQCQKKLEKFCHSIFYLVFENPGCTIKFLKQGLSQRYRNRIKGLTRKMIDEGSIREENSVFYAVDEKNIQYLPRRTRSMSALENSAIDILTRLGITFQQQYKNPLCKYKKMLPFDFAIWINGQIALIEMDGKQHSSPVSIFGGQQSFEEQCVKDSIKNAFCKENGIPLLRIDYTVSLKEREEAIKHFVHNLKTNFVGKSYK